VTRRATGRESSRRNCPGLEALVDDLRSDLCEELKLTVESAADSGADDAFARIKQMAMAFRAWALGHPAEFSLLFDLRSRELAGACDPSYEIGSVFLDEFVEMWRRNMIEPSGEALTENCSELCLARKLTVLYPDLSPDRVLAFLRIWMTVCGSVMLEVNGHLGWLIPDGRGLLDTELADMPGWRVCARTVIAR
jgi:hypothetical protein